MCHKEIFKSYKESSSQHQIYTILLKEIFWFLFSVRDNYCVVLDFFQLCRSILTLLFYQLFMWCVWCVWCCAVKFFCVSLYHHSSHNTSFYDVVELSLSFFFFWIKSICQFSYMWYVVLEERLMRFSLLVVALKLSQSLHPMCRHHVWINLWSS
jgi:hypothetical protein